MDMDRIEEGMKGNSNMLPSGTECQLNVYRRESAA